MNEKLFPKINEINTYNQAIYSWMIRPNRSNLGLNKKGKYASVKKEKEKKGKSQSPKSSTLVKKRNLLKATFYL